MFGALLQPPPLLHTPHACANLAQPNPHAFAHLRPSQPFPDPSRREERYHELIEKGLVPEFVQTLLAHARFQKQQETAARGITPDEGLQAPEDVYCLFADILAKGEVCERWEAKEREMKRIGMDVAARRERACPANWDE